MLACSVAELAGHLLARELLEPAARAVGDLLVVLAVLVWVLHLWLATRSLAYLFIHSHPIADVASWGARGEERGEKTYGAGAAAELLLGGVERLVEVVFVSGRGVGVLVVHACGGDRRRRFVDLVQV